MMGLPVEVQKKLKPLLERWGKEKDAAEKFAESYKYETELKAQYFSAARTYGACIKQLSEILYH